MKRTLLTGMLAGLIINFLGALSPLYADLNDGLVAYYPLDGNAYDASGNGYHGTVNGASPTADRFGIAARAYAFDGSNDYVALPGTENLNFKPGNFTLCAWVALTGYNADQVIVAKHICGYGNGYLRRRASIQRPGFGRRRI